jgi:FlaA1/EpsC-like NDP-sugar epimerase
MEKPPVKATSNTSAAGGSGLTGSDVLESAAALTARYPLLRRGLLIGMDALMLFASLGLAYFIGFQIQPDRFTEVYHRQFMMVVPWLIGFRLVLLWWLGLYRGFTRYTGIYELLTIAGACLGGTTALVIYGILSFYVEKWIRVPYGVVAIDALLSINAVAGIRLSRRIAGERLVDMRSHLRRRVLIVGASDAGEHVARNMLKVYRDRFQPVAFIDPDPRVVGGRIHGIPVAGTLDEMVAVCRRHRVDTVVIATPRTTPKLLRELIDKAQEARLEFQIVPELEALIEGHVEIGRLRPVEIEDLLGRPPVEAGDHEGRSCVAGRRALVTGAGGSIGAELCRQALEHRPSMLILLGRGENSIYEILHELMPRAAQLKIPLEPIVGDVRDEALVAAVFARFKPQVVLHAAAHKHVHFMEAQPAEAIKNNVRGTRLVAQAAQRAGAEKMILISTDKAVRPTGVMGASKRLAELIVTALNKQGPTRYVSVRFGNVLGSRGSVIPLFRRQIAAGGPVTVTDPDVTRYFMTIPEAVSLVLEAGTQGTGGEVFLLDMGEPIRIVDLARQLITLSGLEPGRDIAIEFTGLRPGEKLHEELLTAEENRQPTEHPKIFKCPRSPLDWTALGPAVGELESIAAGAVVDEAALRGRLRELIPDYQIEGQAKLGRASSTAIAQVGSLAAALKNLHR